MKTHNKKRAPIIIRRPGDQKFEDKRESFLAQKEELRTENVIPGSGEDIKEYLKIIGDDNLGENIKGKEREGDEDWEAYKAGRIGRS